MNELDKLRPEVREAIEVMDRLNTVTGSWNLLRAELTRMADENAQLREQTKAPAVVWKQRAESAEAELAALKARIAEAPVATLVYGQADMLAVLSAENADDWAGKHVRLVVED